ncbi:MAG: Glu/Leu/Phe/Val dehydrogenase dimerization domain-containing protein [Planctomycetota bacterium]
MSLSELAARLEALHLFHDRETGLVAAIAVDDTRLGPPRGGTRLRAYPDLLDGAREAARLARGMTCKFAIHGLPFGGGKAVLLQDEAGARDRALLEARLRAYGRCLERLGGHFATGPDFGVGPAEVAVIREVTPLALGEHGSRAGEATAAGVRVALELALAEAGRGVEGARIAVLGVGAVGGPLARQLAARGARLLLADPDPARLEPLAAELGAETAPAAEAPLAEVDALAPCAVGELFDLATVARLRARVVVGAANDQLVDAGAAAAALAARGIVHVPDYVANGGAAVVLSAKLTGGAEAEVEVAEARIRETTARVLARARARDETPWAAALALVDEVLAGARPQA